jgi:hypothetical protein
MSIALTTSRARPATGLILFTMSLGVLIAQIDTSVVNLAVRSIGADFKASVRHVGGFVRLAQHFPSDRSLLRPDAFFGPDLRA